MPPESPETESCTCVVRGIVFAHELFMKCIFLEFLLIGVAVHNSI